MIVTASGGMRISADTQSRVVPGMSVTMAFSRPARVFNSVLLPEFGGPIKAIVQPEMISRAMSLSFRICFASAAICSRGVESRSSLPSPGLRGQDRPSPDWR